MLTHARLLEALLYDPSTGKFLWNIDRKSVVKKGDPAGTRHPEQGYIYIMIDGKKYAAHRLAWFYVHGFLPPEVVDHKNLVRDDNRISNLRLATRSQNGGNARIGAHNSSGLKGVWWYTRGKCWCSSIMVAGNNKWLGCFSSKEEAHSAYVAAAQEGFGEFARKA